METHNKIKLLSIVTTTERYIANTFNLGLCLGALYDGFNCGMNRAPIFHPPIIEQYIAVTALSSGLISARSHRDVIENRLKRYELTSREGYLSDSNMNEYLHLKEKKRNGELNKIHKDQYIKEPINTYCRITALRAIGYAVGYGLEKIVNNS